jgi:hypothetical protein
MKGDGNHNTRYTCRSQSANNQTQSRSRSGTQDLKSAKDGSGFITSPWKIPRFPDSWKHSFGHSLFSLLVEWRTAASCSKSQGQLNSEYDTVVEKFRHENPRHSKSQTRSSRRTSNSPPASTSTTQSSSTAMSHKDDDAQSVSNKEQKSQKRKRIRLNKTRRVITERNA